MMQARSTADIDLRPALRSGLASRTRTPCQCGHGPPYPVRSDEPPMPRVQPMPWNDHPTVGAITGTVRRRLGVSPNHPSFRVGALRTHRMTADLAHAAAARLGASAEIYLRWDDSDAERTDPAHERGLL